MQLVVALSMVLEHNIPTVITLQHPPLSPAERIQINGVRIFQI